MTCTFDGASIPIKPGKNYGFPAIAVGHAKAQNRIMGSTHPYNPTKFDSLIGVDGTKDPVSPIEQSTKIEVFDRSQIGGLASDAVTIAGQPMSAWEAREGTQTIDGDALAADH